MQEKEWLRERFDLVRERLEAQLDGESVSEEYREYFETCASFARSMCDLYIWIEGGGLQQASLEELKQRNKALYREVLPEWYESSYLNPRFAAARLGEEMGQALCGIYAAMRSMIGACYEQDLENLVVYLELFMEVYCRFCEAFAEEGDEPEAREIRQIYYWFVSDYADVFTRKRILKQIDPQACFAARIVREADLTDLRYLYRYGVYVSEGVLRMAAYMNSLPEEKIVLMADTYTEGYRMGFELAGKDLSKKRTAGVYYHLGFERMMRRAFTNLEQLGLQPVVPGQLGYTGAHANRQYEYDHKEDQALVLDKAYVNRELEVLRTVYEEHKELAGGYAGPAVLEVFGEEPFAPTSKPQALRFDEKQQQLSVEYVSASREIQRRYILPEERSFTIIAFPVPEIGERFEEIFDEVIGINTLDYKLYQRIQQTIIDTLDQAAFVELKGMNGNRTDLTVALHQLRDPAGETLFENCVADVNIPVGEVFTSPRLAGTDGVLHVSRVFLNELEYKDLEMVFRDGMIADYTCSNFADEEENRKYIRDNVLFHQETLPMGEFAIGTNTTAYVAAARYDMGAKLPILIAEKMGPHFAVGDTCYSHEEDLVTYNPDGKKIVARENEVSARRKEPGAKAYFNCHTDITIPYDELGELTAVKADGSRISIIEKGRFALAGCEELNRPFED